MSLTWYVGWVMTYDDFFVDDMVALVVVQRDEIGQDSHHNNGRDPDDDIADSVEGVQPHGFVTSNWHGLGLWTT